MLAFIGGSGIYDIDSVTIIKDHIIKTPFGNPSDKIVELESNGHRFFFLPRHGKGHKISPSQINYLANIYALKTLGVENIVSATAVGSLKEEIRPESFYLPDQFIDWTKSQRERTYFKDGIVGHVSNAYPINNELKKIIYTSCKEVNIDVAQNGSYICIEGPQFSTRAESELYRSFGATVIGMTNVPEAFLAKEAGINYATMAMITDYDCWKEEACNVEDIMRIMKNNTLNAKKVIPLIVDQVYANRPKKSEENKMAIVSDQSELTANQKEIIETLLK